MLPDPKCSAAGGDRAPQIDRRVYEVRASAAEPRDGGRTGSREEISRPAVSRQRFEDLGRRAVQVSDVFFAVFRALPRQDPMPFFEVEFIPRRMRQLIAPAPEKQQQLA